MILRQGDTVGSFKLLRFSGQRWLVTCSCGKLHSVAGVSLFTGCPDADHRELAVGSVWGRLTVTGTTVLKGSGDRRRRYVPTQCSCGRVELRRVDQLLRGVTSCSLCRYA